MKIWIRYCLLDALMAGEKRHPEAVIREQYPDAEHFEPQSICDAVFFWATPEDNGPFKPFAAVPKYRGHSPGSPGYTEE